MKLIFLDSHVIMTAAYIILFWSIKNFLSVIGGLVNNLFGGILIFFLREKIADCRPPIQKNTQTQWED